MKLKFYLDTHIPKQVSIQLRNRGIEIIRCEEVGMAEATDNEHLVYAVANECAVITKDDDFLDIHVQYLEQNQIHLLLPEAR